MPILSPFIVLKATYNAREKLRMKLKFYGSPHKFMG
ncbi:MAG: hypothetical protein JWR19_1782 [Pedosphaera sp.]|nr:hypothetical protein [Pedosphaera sp.]